MSALKLIDTASPVTSEDFDNIEKQFNIVFPSSLRKHYAVNNGGIPEGYVMLYVPKGETAADAIERSFSGFYPIRYRTYPKESTLEDVCLELGVQQERFDLHKYIPFASDVGGYPILMEIESQKIYLLNMDDVDENGKEVIEFTSNSLEEFLDGLISKEEYEESC